MWVAKQSSWMVQSFYVYTLASRKGCYHKYYDASLFQEWMVVSVSNLAVLIIMSQKTHDTFSRSADQIHWK